MDVNMDTNMQVDKDMNMDMNMSMNMKMNVIMNKIMEINCFTITKHSILIKLIALSLQNLAFDQTILSSLKS